MVKNKVTKRTNKIVTISLARIADIYERIYEFLKKEDCIISDNDR